MFPMQSLKFKMVGFFLNLSDITYYLFINAKKSYISATHIYSSALYHSNLTVDSK